jgi:hypothetical protein
VAALEQRASSNPLFLFTVKDISLLTCLTSAENISKAKKYIKEIEIGINTFGNS